MRFCKDEQDLHGFVRICKDLWTFMRIQGDSQGFARFVWIDMNWEESLHYISGWGYRCWPKMLVPILHLGTMKVITC